MLKSRMRAIARSRMRRQMFRDVREGRRRHRQPDAHRHRAPVRRQRGARADRARDGRAQGRGAHQAARVRPRRARHREQAARPCPARRGARVGVMIPAELYAAVAEVLAFVIRQRARYGAWRERAWERLRMSALALPAGGDPRSRGSPKSAWRSRWCSSSRCWSCRCRRSCSTCCSSLSIGTLARGAARGALHARPAGVQLVPGAAAAAHALPAGAQRRAPRGSSSRRGAAGQVIQAFGAVRHRRQLRRRPRPVPDPRRHQLHRHHQGRRPRGRGGRALHARRDAGQADGDRRRPQRRPHRREPTRASAAR